MLSEIIRMNLSSVAGKGKRRGNRKATCTLILLLTLWQAVNVYAEGDKAQATKTKMTGLYLSCGIGSGFRGNMFGISGNTMFSGGWGGGITFRTNTIKAENIPVNYKTADCARGDCTPRDNVYHAVLLLSKDFTTGSKYIKYGFETGPSWIVYKHPQFGPNPNSGINESNYHTTYTYRKSAGWSLRAKLEFPFFSFMGIEVAVFSGINRYKSYAGIELFFLMGYVRNRNIPLINNNL